MSAHTRQSVLAEAVEYSEMLVLRFAAGFDDSNHTKQSQHLPNHFAWCMGHLALTMHRVAGQLDGSALPPDEFMEGAKGDSKRFGTESISFASRPIDDASMYPAHARCVAIFKGAISRLAAAVRRADDAALDTLVKWGAGEATLASLIPRMVYHNGVHAGQIIDLRRALGMKGVLG